MFYYIYVLYSKRGRSIYTGFTDDLRRRFNEHQKGLVLATRNRRPLELIYFEGYRNKKGCHVAGTISKNRLGKKLLAKSAKALFGTAKNLGGLSFRLPPAKILQSKT
jgi:putative endonuclease